ncbi:MAG: hypothetical protein ACMXYB_04085 [Candidatus Woesearchaeota archaeon]
MRIKISDGCCRISSESKLEYLLLNSNYLKSKLAYSELRPNSDNFGEIEFNRNKPFLFDLGENKFNFNIDEESKVGYLLRIIVDSMSVNVGNLPLHSAYAEVNQLGIFLFGDMYGGKSSTLISLKDLDGIKLIGDDHILIGGKKISGNLMSRIRTQQGESFFPLEGSSKKIDTNIIFNLFPSNINSFKYQKKDEYLEDGNSLDAVLKYLNRNPIFNGIKYDLSNIVGKPIIEKYFSLFRNFVFESEFIVKVSGEHEYIKEKVREVIENK